MYNNDLPTRAELPSSKQLLRSTLIAIVVAAVLLVTVVCPANTVSIQRASAACSASLKWAR